METSLFLMTITKRKITEVESIVNKADNRKTAGKIYLPKDWIGKKVKTILLSKGVRED
jgi:putative transposon-encoded protein